jgi:hypothetical protein
VPGGMVNSLTVPSRLGTPIGGEACSGARIALVSLAVRSGEGGRRWPSGPGLWGSAQSTICIGGPVEDRIEHDRPPADFDHDLVGITLS